MEGGGAERVVQTLSNYLDTKYGYEIKIISLESGKVAYKLNENIQHLRLKTGFLNKSIGKIISIPIQAFELSRILKKEKPDILLSLLTRANLVNINSKLYGNTIPLIISERSPVEKRYSSQSIKDIIMQWCVKRYYSKANGIIAISACVAQSLVNVGIQSDKIEVIHNPQTNNSISIEESVPPRKSGINGIPKLITIGRLIDQKDHISLLRSFKLLNEILDSELFIIGDGKNRSKLLNYARELKVSDRVEFTGWVDDPSKYLKSSDVFLLSSKYEGFGNVIVEAMSCGLPIISTDCPGGPREILEDGKYGVLVPVGDTRAMADAIYDMISDIDLYSYYREQSLKRAKAFDVRVIGEEYLNYLKRFSNNSN